MTSPSTPLCWELTVLWTESLELVPRVVSPVSTFPISLVRPAWAADGFGWWCPPLWFWPVLDWVCRLKTTANVAANDSHTSGRLPIVLTWLTCLLAGRKVLSLLSNNVEWPIKETLTHESRKLDNLFWAWGFSQRSLLCRSLDCSTILGWAS